MEERRSRAAAAHSKANPAPSAGTKAGAGAGPPHPRAARRPPTPRPAETAHQEGTTDEETVPAPNGEQRRRRSVEEAGARPRRTTVTGAQAAETRGKAAVNEDKNGHSKVKERSRQRGVGSGVKTGPSVVDFFFWVRKERSR